MKASNILIFGLIFLLASCGQTKYLNSTYKPDKEKLKLALIPIYNQWNNMNDTLHSEIFNDSLQTLKEIKPQITRRIINSDRKLAKTINKITKNNYDKRKLKEHPNLKDILSSDEIEYIKNSLKGSDLMLIPIAFNIKSVGDNISNGHTFGHSNFRMYDLNTGEFIFECHNDINVNIGGRKGAKSITAVLLGMSHSYYEENFLTKNEIE